MQTGKHTHSQQKFLTTVRQTILEHAMFKPEDSVLVAVSGGADSVALLHALRLLCPQWRLRLGVAHLNHGLRAEAANDDQNFVRRLCNTLGFRFHTATVDVAAYRQKNRLSLEEAARRARYRFLEQNARQGGYQKIALGHHLDDNAELVLMFLLRGSGSLGISGMPAVRPPGIVRPLFDCTRETILDYLAREAIDYIHDDSNRELRYRRNAIRHELLPLIKANYNPAISKTLHRTAMIQKDEERWLETIVERTYKRLIEPSPKDQQVISVPELRKLAIALQRRLLRRILRQAKGNLRRIGFVQIEAIRHIVLSSNPRGQVDLVGGIHVRRQEKRLIITAPVHCSPPPQEREKIKTNWKLKYQYQLPRRGSYFIKAINATLELIRMEAPTKGSICLDDSNVALFDVATISFPLMLRNYLPGDRFIPLGMTGAQKLKKFFASQKIPAHMRRQKPVLLSKGEIVWIVGHRIDNRIRVRRSTRDILQIRVRRRDGLDSTLTATAQ